MINHVLCAENSNHSAPLCAYLMSQSVAGKHRAPVARPSPIDAFQERCEARAILFGAGELDLHHAVDELQAVAVTSGVVDALGQDAVQTIMATEFKRWRDA